LYVAGPPASSFASEVATRNSDATNSIEKLESWLWIKAEGYTFHKVLAPRPQPQNERVVVQHSNVAAEQGGRDCVIAWHK
jgi:hypothetical protein